MRRGTTLKRGVRTGSRRGKYNHVPADTRKRILDCYRAGGHWKVPTTANGVAAKTTYDYIRRGDGDGDRVPRKRGSATVRKVSGQVRKVSSATVRNVPLVIHKHIHYI